VLAKAAKVGAQVPDSLDVISHLVLASWPLGFLIPSLVLLWGTKPRRHDDEPVPTRP
jgi:hypothetical protein